VEPIRNSLSGSAQRGVKIITRLRSITESDRAAGAGIEGIIGFNTGLAWALASRDQGVEINLYSIIYGLVEDVEKAPRECTSRFSRTWSTATPSPAGVQGQRQAISPAACPRWLVSRNSLVRVTRGSEVVAESDI
jgi:hypothetical protein